MTFRKYPGKIFVKENDSPLRVNKCSNDVGILNIDFTVNRMGILMRVSKILMSGISEFTQLKVVKMPKTARVHTFFKEITLYYKIP